MRFLSLSLGAGLVIAGTALAQSPGSSGNGPQLPVGQTFKQFEFPIYQESKLKASLHAAEATGITLNRAETIDLVIKIYGEEPAAATNADSAVVPPASGLSDDPAVTTTVTSPKADLYVTEQKMRTKNTVKIDRADMVVTSQNCDFDLKTKKYLLRTNVRVVLKHFDVSGGPNGVSPTAPKSSVAAPKPAAARPAPLPDSILTSPGSAGGNSGKATP